MLLFSVSTWQSVHPMIVHFAIAFLLTAPLFVLIGAVLTPPRGRPFMLSALILLSLGAAGLFFAIPTGEAAAKLLPKDDASASLLIQHQSLAFEARGLFVMLLVLYISVLLVPRALHRDGRLFSTILPMAFLLLYCAAGVVLISAAHEGAALRHEAGRHTVQLPEARGNPMAPSEGN